MPVGDRFVVIRADAMFPFLESKGFTRVEGRSRLEVVYERKHHRDPRYKVLIYTSISCVASRARDLGQDAIRVVAIFDDGNFSRGVKKTPKVLRTGSVEKVLDRTIERARDAYAACNERLRRS